MSMETIRENIIENLRTSLQDVKTVNGYYFDLKDEAVQRWSMHGNSMVDLPMVIISPGDEEEKSLPNNFEECLLTVYLDVFFVHSEDASVSTDTYLNRLQGDFKKAVLADRTRGGYAVDTDISGTTPFEVTEGQAYAGIIMELSIRYRHIESDPANQ